VRVTVLGHAGLLIESGSTSLVCDPWFTPAFLGSWFPFPRNDRLGDEVMARVTNPTLLYISHLHGDHLDEPFLRDEMNHDTLVLLPDFPGDELEITLRALGFTRFVHLDDRQARLVSGLEILIGTETAVTDGPQGDSYIVVGDSSGRLLNQNDCRPHDLDAVARLGPVDLQFLQYSGAIWYPMVYEMDNAEMQRLKRAKREAQLTRAMQYVSLVGARAVVPFAGPPAFLDAELFHLNALDDSDSIFPDQRVFLGRLAAAGRPGVFAVPGSEIDVATLATSHPDNARFAYDHQSEALVEYSRDWAPWLAAEHARWSESQPDLVARLAAWWEPLLDNAPNLRRALGASVLIRSGDTDVVIDFPAGQVRAWDGEEIDFRFEIDRRVLETVVAQRAVDWSNSLFLSCRFRAWRSGAYNEYVYNFFKSLSPARMARAEAEATRALGGSVSTNARGELLDSGEVRFGDYLVQRYCPHRQADLARFGELEGDKLVCTLHGWHFELPSGFCVSSVDRFLRVRRADDGTGDGAPDGEPILHP
jgi:UDP-MurNAc hydroxylase